MWEALLSVKATITLPKVVKLLFIFLASSKVYPWAPVFIIFSDPAKSTKKSFPILQEPSSLFVILIVKMNKECDLELSLFISVDEIALL